MKNKSLCVLSKNNAGIWLSEPKKVLWFYRWQPSKLILSFVPAAQHLKGLSDFSVYINETEARDLGYAVETMRSLSHNADAANKVIEAIAAFVASRAPVLETWVANSKADVACHRLQRHVVVA